jgi:hypothetical protein
MPLCVYEACRGVFLPCLGLTPRPRRVLSGGAAHRLMRDGLDREGCWGVIGSDARRGRTGRYRQRPPPASLASARPPISNFAHRLKAPAPIRHFGTLSPNSCSSWALLDDGSIAGDYSWAYVQSKEIKHDRSSRALSWRSFRRGHLLYCPGQRYEAGFLRNRALDLVGLCVCNVGHNSRGQPGRAASDPSKMVGPLSFAAALLRFAQLKTSFGLTSRAFPAPRAIPNLGRDGGVQTRGLRQGMCHRVQGPERRVIDATPPARLRPVCA